MNASREHFSQMADAMEQVAALPHDPEFIDLIHQYRIASTVHYQQDTTKAPFCLDTSLLHTLSADDFLGRSIVTVEGLSLEGHTSENTTFIAGEATLNQTPYTIQYSSDEQKALFYERDHRDLPASIELTSQQLTELVASGLILNHDPNLDTEDILDVWDQVLPGDDVLPALLYRLGEVNGMSTRTTTALLNDEGHVLAAKLTENESPHDNGSQDTLSIYSGNELFTDTSHLIKEKSSDPARSHSDQSEYALRGFTQATAGQASMNDLVNGTESPHLTRYESSGSPDTAREYARTCIAFLDAYQRARKTNR